MGHKRIDITGKIYGKVTVLEFSHINLPNHLAYWKCRCDCGNVFITDGHSLRRGNVKSCGCKKSSRLHDLMYKDITNQKFGSLTAKFDVGRTKSGKTLWECQCDCGRTIYVPAGDLRSMKSTSCGECLHSWKGELNPRWKGGICKNPYSEVWNKKLKGLIRDLDSHKCRFPGCEYNDVEEKAKLNVHHIDGNKMNCDLKNLISLCSSHHHHIESNSPRSWEEYFYSVTFGREK